MALAKGTQHFNSEGKVLRQATEQCSQRYCLLPLVIPWLGTTGSSRTL